VYLLFDIGYRYVTSGPGIQGEARMSTVDHGGTPTAASRQRGGVPATGGDGDGASTTADETVAAVGKVTEAREWVERARGRLYDFHQMMGHADLLFGDAADALEHAGHRELADGLREEIVGRNVLDGRWTFQIVDEFDDCYYDPVRAFDGRVARELVGGRRHAFEAALKEERRTHGRRHHERAPTTVARVASSDG
jgi:hypothetical protein